MKFDKLIELLKEMETTIEAEENQTLLEKLNREEMINTMQFLQRCAAQAGYYYNLQAPGSEFGTMKLQTAENDDPIVAQVKNVTQLIARISHSTQEQADGLSSLTRAVDELNLITQKNAELVEESAQVSAMVKHRASRLEDAVTVLH